MTEDAETPVPARPQPAKANPAVGAPESRSGNAAPAVTALLRAWTAGDDAALDALVPVVYTELRRQAARAMRRESTGHTLSPTALVHEAYVRLVQAERVPWQNRAQFFGVAARLMRRVLVDHARARHAAKRGGHDRQISLADVGQAEEDGTDAADVLAVHDALQRLAALDPEQARLVELRYFGGLTIEETATVLSVSPATVKREWVIARAWLRRELGTP